MDVIDALVTFSEGYKQDGIGPDGLPLFVPVLKVTLGKPPLTKVEYEGEEAEAYISQAPDAYRAFEKTRDARAPAKGKGYPLMLWPVVSPAELQMLLVRDVLTVEQLAQLTFKPAAEMPPSLRELAIRARDFLKLQKETGRFEAMVTDLTQQRDALAEQLKDANATISAQNAQIEQLRMRPAMTPA